MVRSFLGRRPMMAAMKTSRRLRKCPPPAAALPRWRHSGMSAAPSFVSVALSISRLRRLVCRATLTLQSFSCSRYVSSTLGRLSGSFWVLSRRARVATAPTAWSGKAGARKGHVGCFARTVILGSGQRSSAATIAPAGEAPTRKAIRFSPSIRA